MQSEFVISAAKKEQWPDTNLPEVVVVGRSNVGKSSFINALTNKKKLAYVGHTPGKTQLINFFLIDKTWMLVDVPGYGYAKLSKTQIEKMGKMMDEYFLHRKNIVCVIQLVDARHMPTGDDLDMIDFFKERGIPIIVAATKIDKVPKTKRLSELKKIAKKVELPLSQIYPVSSLEKTGFEVVEEKIKTYTSQSHN